MYLYLFVIVLLFQNINCSCAFTNIRNDLEHYGDNSNIEENKCDYGDFICKNSFYNDGKDYHIHYGKDYYTCNKDNKWEIGNCNDQNCYMTTNIFGCACDWTN